MHGVDKKFINLVHDGIGFISTDLFHQGSKSLQVTKHNGDLLSFTFDPVSLGEDLLGKSLGQVLLDLIQFLFKGEFFGRWRGRFAKLVAAIPTEKSRGPICRIAFRTIDFQLIPALVTEFIIVRIVGLTLCAFH